MPERIINAAKRSFSLTQNAPNSSSLLPTTRPPIAAVPLRLLAGPGAEDLKAARDDDATDGDHGMAG